MSVLTGTHRRHVVLVGGLGDALLFANYATVLAPKLNALGWWMLLLDEMLDGDWIGSRQIDGNI